MGSAWMKWLEIIDRYRLSPERPDSENFWSTKLETASADELRHIQNEKLRVAADYVYEYIPFYRRKFDRIGLKPADIRSVDDLEKIPVTTKHEMASDMAENLPWGDFTAVDDRVWKERGWQIFASSGTTGQARVFRYTEFDRTMWAWMDARALWAMGFRPNRDVAMLAFGYGPHVWLWGVHYALNLMGIPILTGGRRGRARAGALRHRLQTDDSGVHAVVFALSCERHARYGIRSGCELGALCLLRGRAGLQRAVHPQEDRRNLGR